MMIVIKNDAAMKSYCIIRITKIRRQEDHREETLLAQALKNVLHVLSEI